MTTTDLSLQAQATSIGQLERELADLWKRSAAAAGCSPMRARTLNLVVWVGSSAERERIANVVASLAMSHPSRSIVLSPMEKDAASAAEAAPGIRAQLSTQCHALSNRLLCYEQIMLDVADDRVEHLAALVEPLLVSDLPTFLWWVGEPPHTGGAFHEFLRIVDHVVVDSLRFGEPVGALQGLMPLMRQRKATIDDLNWDRLTPWRELIAQFFNGEAGLAHLAGIRQVSVRYGAGNGTQALLLLGWLASRLGWQVRGDTVTGPQNRPISLQLAEIEGDRGQILAVELESAVTGGSGRFTVECRGGHVVSSMRGMDLPELERTTDHPPRSEAELLQAELRLRTHDLIFEAALEVALRLAPHVSGFRFQVSGRDGSRTQSVSPAPSPE